MIDLDADSGVRARLFRRDAILRPPGVKLAADQGEGLLYMLKLLAGDVVRLNGGNDTGDLLRDLLDAALELQGDAGELRQALLQRGAMTASRIALTPRTISAYAP